MVKETGKFSTYISYIVLVAIFIGWTVAIYQFHPTQIAEQLGINNGYAIAFVLAFFGGLSTFISIPYYLVVFTLATGGLNPVVLGIAAGSGVFLGDSTSYFVGYKGRDILPSNLQRIFQKFCGWCITRPSWLVPLVIFSYGAFVPFPNDFLVISMGLARYPYWKLMVPLGLGNVTFNIGVALAGSYGLSHYLGL